MGFAAGRNPYGPSPEVFLKPLDTLSTLQHRQAQAQHFQDQARRDAAKLALEEKTYGLEEKTYGLKEREAARQEDYAKRTRPLLDRFMSRFQGGGDQAPQTLPTTPREGPPSQLTPSGLTLPEAPPAPLTPRGTGGEKGATPLTPSPSSQPSRLPQTPQTPLQPIPSSQFSSEVELGPQGPTFRFKETPQQAQGEIGKVADDYARFLRDFAPYKGSPEYARIEGAFIGKLAEASRVTMTTDTAKLAQDIRILAATTAPNDTDAQKAITALRTQFRATRLGQLESPIGKQIQDREALLAAGLVNDAKTMNQAIQQSLNPPEKTTQELSLTSQYARLSGDFVTKKTNYVQLAKAYMDNLQSPTGVNDSTMIFAYMKMVDPTSVVREAEYERAAKMTSIPEWLRQYFMPDGRIAAGTVLAPEVRGKMLSGATGILSSAIPLQVKDVEAVYSRLAQKYGFSPIHPFSGLPTPRAVADQALDRAGGDPNLAAGFLVLQGHNFMDVR